MLLLARCCWPVLLLVFGLSTTLPLAAQETKQPGKLTIDRIFHDNEFQGESYGPVRWLSKHSGYTIKVPSAQHKGFFDIVRVDPATGKQEVLVPAGQLIPPDRSRPLAIEDYQWSKNEGLLLIYTNSQRVWRKNSRGDYWVYDLSSRTLRPLGKDAPPASLMYAHFSPDGRMVAYVRDRDLYVEELTSDRVVRLTQAESPDIINGAFDWVYEEEFGLYDGFRWSPDSKMIAFWQLDTRGVDDYFLVNHIAGLYQQLTRFKYPKTGRPNAACRVGVLTLSRQPGGDLQPKAPHWFKLPGDPREHYIARMDWVGNDRELVLQQLNRLQNTNTLFLADALTGNIEPILVERDRAWVDVHDDMHWLDRSKKFIWLSERSGWQQAYLAPRNGGALRTITPNGCDVMKVASVDENGGWLYYTASPENATQCYLHRVRLDGSQPQRLTPAEPKGWHSYDISPDCRWAIHTYSTFDLPAVVSLISLPDHQVVRILADNKKLHDKVKALERRPVEFFRVDIGNSVELDGWLLKPPDFDPAKKYPVLFHVYGEPAGQTVLDRWGDTKYLWHLLLAQQGYLVASVDNRGTPAPRGREWRKAIYRQIGILNANDQAAAARALLQRWSFADRQRVGVWGWSGGGSMSLNLIFRFPDLYHTALSIAPVTNQRYYDTIYQERYMGLPQDNPQGYRDGSPITHAHQLKGNLLLVHGTGDDNVHYACTEALIDELIAHNKQFTVMPYPNRTHAIREGRNTRRHLFTLLTRYLNQHLPAGGR